MLYAQGFSVTAYLTNKKFQANNIIPIFSISVIIITTSPTVSIEYFLHTIIVMDTMFALDLLIRNTIVW